MAKGHKQRAKAVMTYSSKHLIALTSNQEHVLKALKTAKKPLSAYTILDQLRTKGFKAPLQVYRALEALQKLNLVHRLESLNAFVSCNHEHDRASDIIAFAICRTCGSVSEFCDAAISKPLKRVASQQSFTIKNTTIELNGLCNNCAN